MARVVLPNSLRIYTDGELEFDLDVRDIRDLLDQLGARYPKLKPHVEEGMAVAIDGQIYQDTWLEPIAADSEVYIIPKIAGG